MTFTCPYAEQPLTEQCQVSSCNFNLEPTNLSKSYKRCFLNYMENLNYNPYNQDQDVSFGKMPPKQRKQIAAAMLGTEEKEVDKANRSFYLSLFSILAQDALFSLPRYELSPVPYRQCAVCGEPTEELYIPKKGIFPPGYGYCSFSCYRLKPPPVLSLEITLGVEYEQLIDGLRTDLVRNRLHFVRQLVDWVLSGTPMT